jgi:hypothetical protein
VTDAAEYVLIARGADGVVERLSALINHYAYKYGRFNPVVFAGIAFKWTLFGNNPAAWYWSRFTVMSGVVVLAHLVVRRVGGSAAAGVAAAAMFVFASQAAQGWYLLSIGEPVGCVFVLGAMWLAAGYRTVRRWAWTCAWITVCLTAAVLAKEMLIYALPVAFIIAACHEQGGKLLMPRFDARTVALVLACTVTLGVAALFVLWAAHLPDEGFPSQYSLANLSAESLARVSAAVLPVLAARPDERLPAVIGSAFFLAALWLGARPALRAGGERRRNELQWLAAGLVTPLVGTALYAPWPYVDISYFIPMLLGSALLVGRAVSAGFAHSKEVGRGVLSVYTCALMIAATLDWRSARRLATMFRVVDGAVRAASASRGVERVDAHVPRPSARAWDELGPMYARAFLGRSMPTTVSVACGMPRPVGVHWVLALSSGCGELARPTATFVGYLQYIDWTRLRIARDSVRIDLRCEPPTATVPGADTCLEPLAPR